MPSILFLRLSLSETNFKFSGNGSPCVSTVDSSATTPRLLATASRISGETTNLLLLGKLREDNERAEGMHRRDNSRGHLDKDVARIVRF